MYKRQAKQLPKLTKKAQLLKAIDQGKLPKSQSLVSGAFIYDRLPTTHHDRCYDWVSQLIDTLVAKEQQDKNKYSLVLDASGKEQPPQKPTKTAMPAQTSEQGGQPESSVQNPGGSATGGGHPAGRGTAPEGKGGGKKGKKG